jgi:hypothetical protein
MVDLTGASNVLTNTALKIWNNSVDAVLIAITFAIAFIIGLIVADIVVWAVQKLLKKGNLEQKIKQKGLQNALVGFTITQVVSVLLKIYIVLAFLGAAAQIVEISFFSTLISDWLGYLSSFSQGIAIIAVALFAVTYITNTIRKEQKILFANQIALGLKVLVSYVALVLALDLILPMANTEILKQIFYLFLVAIVAAFGLATGLGLGLGLKESVSKAAQKNQQVFDDFFSKMGRK